MRHDNDQSTDACHSVLESFDEFTMVFESSWFFFNFKYEIEFFFTYQLTTVIIVNNFVDKFIQFRKYFHLTENVYILYVGRKIQTRKPYHYHKDILSVEKK